jgi:hypothetical protein
MKRSGLIVLLVSAFMSITSFGQQVQVPATSSPKYIWRNIPFISGADLYNFKNTFSKTREEARQEMVGETIDLMYYGATGYEALMMILKFDELYDFHRAQAKQGLDITLEFQFKAALQAFMDQYAIKAPKVAFLNGNSVSEIVEAARRAKKLKNIADESIPQMDFLALGTFSPDLKGQGALYVALELIDLRGNPSLTFDANGASPQIAAQKLAFKVFDYFQKTQFPGEIRRGDQSKLTVLGTPSGDLNAQARCEDAADDCKHMGGRLPTLKELEEIHRWGRYNGGIYIDPHNTYCLNKPGYAYVAHFDRYREQPISLLNGIHFHYFCVR